MHQRLENVLWEGLHVGAIADLFQNLVLATRSLHRVVRPEKLVAGVLAIETVPGAVVAPCQFGIESRCEAAPICIEVIKELVYASGRWITLDSKG
jgi:hypothetical protein